MIQANELTTSQNTLSNFDKLHLLDYQSSSKWEAFGDKQILQGLHEDFSRLGSRVTQLEKASWRFTSYPIPINDLGSAKYKLNSPIYVFMSKEKGYFLVEAVDFEIYALGGSEKEAINKFKEVLTEYFENLSSSSKKMSKDLKAKYKLLKRLISNEK